VSKALIWVNRDVVRELTWVVNHLCSAEGVYFFISVSWSYAHLPDRVMWVYTDMSGVGLAFLFPSLNTGFQSPLPGSAPVGTIFYYEALAVTATLLNAIPRLGSGQRVTVFTDNLNMVSMFNSLVVLPPYNWLLMTAVEAILASHVDFRVFYILGVENVVADHLSGWQMRRLVWFFLDSIFTPFCPLDRCWGQRRNDHTLV
jgi:hypothetical protein